MVTRMGHMGLRVPDLDAAVDFQRDVIGMVETERTAASSYLTCNERHHELILIEDPARRGYDHIGLEVADAAALEAREARHRGRGRPSARRRLRRRARYRPRAARPGARRPRLQALLRHGDRAAARARRPPDQVRARLGQGPQPGPVRALPRATASASASATGWGPSRAGGTATPTTTAWRSCCAPKQRALALRVHGRGPQRDGPRRRPPQAAPRPEADLGTVAPRPRQQPLHATSTTTTAR